MNKELLKEMQLQAGGSHYPDINPQMQEAFARMIIKKCIEAVYNTNKTHAFTTFDRDMVDGTIQRSVKSIIETFGLGNEFYQSKESYKDIETR